MCVMSVLLASVSLSVHILGAVCEAGGNLKPSVAWGHLAPLGSAVRSAGDSLGSGLA